MSQDHEKWLLDQGVSITGQRPFYRAHIDPLEFGPELDPASQSAQAVKISRILEAEKIYQIEAATGVIKRWKRQSEQMDAAMEWAHLRANGHVGSYFVAQYQRHRELLEENPMYRQAWKEFQEVRAILGETTQWP